MHGGWMLRLSGKALGRSMQWFISQQECPSPAHSTPQHGAQIKVDRSWERSATEAARILGGSTVIAVATVPQPPAPAPPAPHHNLALDLG